LNFRNNLTTIIKNESGIKLFWKFPVRLLLDGAAGLLFLVKGKPKNTWAVIRAHFAIFRNFFKILRTRKSSNLIINRYKIGEPEKAGVFKGSIVLNYYLKGKKKFME
jgi:hypothetical protein